jgi:Carboxypeptidase regulatory-like domain
MQLPAGGSLLLITQERLRALGAFVLTATCLSFLANTATSQTRLASGKLAGVVRDSNGIPQMGATVEVVPEIVGAATRLGFLTNTQGVFRGDRVAPGLYTVRVTLAGFLPTLQQHVRISSHLTTVVRIELESMFASLDQLRRQPAGVPVENDDWKWVLRSATVTRPVLEWTDDENDDVVVANSDTQNLAPRARLDFTDGARRPGSVSNLPSAPATAFAYDQKLGGPARLLLAGEMNYEGSAPGGGFATVWLPAGSLAEGSHSALVVRESKLGPAGPTFRGVRVEESGGLAFGDRALLRYSGEYVMVGVAKMASALRPRLELDFRAGNGWQAAVIFASESGAPLPVDPNEREAGSELATALDELDSLPTMLWRDGRPVLEGGWHEEVAAEHKLGSRSEIQVAGFHDDNRHVAIFGRGNDLPAADYFQDYFSNGFAYDGGASGSWGARIALRQRLTEAVELTAVYAYAGALSPIADPIDTDAPMREFLRATMHNSLGANVSARIPRLGTRVDGGYKWLSGLAVSRLDGFGESLYQMEPFLHVGLRQALPKFGPGRWEANARCDNLFAQGYVPVNAQDNHAALVPAFRSFRGGLSVQF